MRCLFPDINPLDFSLCIHQKFVCYAAEVGEVQNFKKIIENRFSMISQLELSRVSGDHCIYVQHPALKLKVDTWSIFFNLQDVYFRTIFYTCVLVYIYFL